MTSPPEHCRLLPNVQDPGWPPLESLTWAWVRPRSRLQGQTSNREPMGPDQVIQPAHGAAVNRSVAGSFIDRGALMIGA